MPMHRLANPARFLRLSTAILPWSATLTVLLLIAGLYLGLFVAPPDYQQSETVRIMYVHVPAAWMALSVYAMMALASAVALIWKHPLADLIAKSCAPIGACFTLIALVTGSLWGQPTWGTWWVWDARLTSVLILFFLGGQSADHQILGRLVEHAAPVGQRDARRGAGDPQLDADPAAADGAGLHMLFRDRVAGARARRDRGAQGPHAADDSGTGLAAC
jgi:ABC-type transport system involved in cytochrome c biogenesis permease subunit